MAIKQKARDLKRPPQFWAGYNAAKRDQYLEEARMCRERGSLASARSYTRVARQFNGLSISYGKRS